MATLLEADEESITVHVPMAFKKHGGRKLMIAPDLGPDWSPPRPRIDNTMVRAIVRAHRWRRLLEEGIYATVDEIAKAEKVNPSYASRVLRLTLLAPDIVEIILDGRQPPGLQLKSLLWGAPVEWEAQRTVFGLTT